MQIEGYFSNNKQLRPDVSKSMEQLHLHTIHKIEKGQLKISAEQQEIILNKAANPQKNIQDLQDNLKKIQESKVQLINKLEEINQEEFQIRKLHSKNKYKGASQNKLQRSRFTNQQKKQIKRALQNKQTFQKSLKKKIQSLNSRIQSQEKQLQDKQEFKKQYKKNMKKLLIKEKRMKTQQEKNKTLEYQMTKKGKISKNQYKYVKNEQKDKQLEKQREKYQTILLTQKKIKMKTDFNQIKQHSMHHESIINRKKQEFLQNLIEKHHAYKKSAVFPESVFTEKIMKEERMQKQQRQALARKKKQMKNKVHEFQEYISQKFKPKVSQNSHFTPRKLTRAINNLSHEQRIKKGNLYLSDVRKFIKRTSGQKSHRDTQGTTGQPFSIIEQSQKKKKYQNYLIQLRKNKKIMHSYDLQKLLSQKITPQKAQKVLKIFQEKEKNKKTIEWRNSESEYTLAKQKISFIKNILELNQ